MTSIRRTATVLRAFWQLNWLEELQYRGNFIASLLGGAIVRTGSIIYDGSVRGQLEKIKQQIATA